MSGRSSCCFCFSSQTLHSSSKANSEDVAAPKPNPSLIRPWRYPGSWTDYDFDEEDWTESEQIKSLSHLPIWGLYKANLPGLNRIIGYTGRIVSSPLEVPALPSTPSIRPPRAPECSRVPLEGIIFHHGLKPRTRVPPGCSLWTNHAALDRRFHFTIPLNKLEYLAMGYLQEVVLPWNR